MTVYGAQPPSKHFFSRAVSASARRDELVGAGAHARVALLVREGHGQEGPALVAGHAKVPRPATSRNVFLFFVFRILLTPYKAHHELVNRV